MKVLMIEDEVYLAEAIVHILKKNNYIVDLVADGALGLEYGLTNEYDIIISDIMLPNLDGITLVKELRKNGIKGPILLLTARGNIEDKIKGLDSGADDYLPKPFHSDELLARLRALGRRSGEFIVNGILEYGNIQLNTSTLQMNCEDKYEKLTLKESQILEMLIKRKNQVISKESIIERVWGYDGDANDNTVEIHISLLRKKIRSLKTKVGVVTIRGVGYTIQENKGELKVDV